MKIKRPRMPEKKPESWQTRKLVLAEQIVKTLKQIEMINKEILEEIKCLNSTQK